MNKWVIFTLFYLAVAISLSYESEPWVRLAWLAPIFAVWAVSFAAAFWAAWKQRNSPSWQPTGSIYAILPKSWQDWVFGEGKHRSGRS